MSCSNCVANWNLFSASCVILHAASSVATQFQCRVCYFYCRCVCLSHCQNVAAASIITCTFKMTKLLLRLLILRFHDSLSLHLQRYSLLSYFGRSSKNVLKYIFLPCYGYSVSNTCNYLFVRINSFKIKPHWFLVKADNSQ